MTSKSQKAMALYHEITQASKANDVAKLKMLYAADCPVTLHFCIHNDDSDSSATSTASSTTTTAGTRKFNNIFEFARELFGTYEILETKTSSVMAAKDGSIIKAHGIEQGKLKPLKQQQQSQTKLFKRHWDQILYCNNANFDSNVEQQQLQVYRVDITFTEHVTLDSQQEITPISLVKQFLQAKTIAQKLSFVRRSNSNQGNVGIEDDSSIGSIFETPVLEYKHCTSIEQFLNEIHRTCLGEHNEIELITELESCEELQEQQLKQEEDQQKKPQAETFATVLVVRKSTVVNKAQDQDEQQEQKNATKRTTDVFEVSTNDWKIMKWRIHWV